ncbi:MAG: camphor resistance protein CrcB [Micavibrio sp. TMED27]|mgnify:FL=1|nr:fluoride efflux transporter CrcB [Micavibrio sp.]OUT90682.1 MAG: camphor resistance protein CrcB [Micavibrio sp. TMED27]|tara:strand:+ start:2726 stop:3109 length:384 start_codon:yes stop_codon:yes gene_type:complete
MVNTLLAIAAGGAAGAILRHGVNIGAVKLFGHGFPFGTFIVNVTGSALMGVVIILLAQMNAPHETFRLFIVTGFLGAFTTFSTYSLDAVTLIQRGDILYAGLYIGGSVIVSITALFAAMALTKGLIS